MEKDLELYMEFLNSDRCQRKHKEAILVLGKITKCFTQEKSQFTLGLHISLLLNKENALFTFIRRMSMESETLPAVTAAFELLNNLVDDFEKSVEPYFSYLFSECLNLANGKFAKVKELSFKLIKNIILADTRHSLDLSKLLLVLEKVLGEKKPGATVLEQCYSLLGFLFEKYPETVKNETYFFIKIYEKLKLENITKSQSVPIVKGAFEGINGYLTTYQAPEGEYLKNIYEYIKIWSNYKEDRKLANRAALKILQNHWSHFSSFIYSDKDLWLLHLEVWKQQKKEDRDAMCQFMYAFYRVIALVIKQKSNHKEALHFMKEFYKTLESKAYLIEKKSALAGIKLFVLTDSVTGDDFNNAYKLVVSFMKKQESLKNTTFFPIGLECASAFVLKASKDNFYLEQIGFLQKLSVKLIENYPDLEQNLQTDALIAFEKSFYLLGLSSLQTVKNHVDKIVYQALIITSSGMILPELELLKESGETPKCVTYKSYISMWKYFLNLSGSPILPVGGSFLLKKAIAEKVLDAFFSAFLRILMKLDFGISSEFEAEKPSDVHIFINMVDLYQDLIPLIDFFSCQKWLIEIFKTVINLSEMNPLVSGFYKIATTTLKISNEIQFFDEISELTGEKEKCFYLLQTFLENILVKVDHFKGELQVACLRVVLASPVCIFKDFIEKTIPALELTAQLARNSSSLLKDLIETLERWNFSLPSATVVEKILPHLDVFLQSPYFRGNNSVDRSKASRVIKNQLVFNDSEFLGLQKKLLLFLGNLEVSKAMNLIELPETEPMRNITDKPLVYSLPCCNAWVEMNLDGIILRVIDLAESCGERKTRIIACELLYSIVMLLLGNINQLSGGYSYLFRKVLRSCLFLGCDSDGLVCQIFEPLMYQITHYLSGKQALSFSETNDFIDILTDHVTCHNSTVRDFSAILLQEFTAWSIKQLTPEELKTTPKSVKRIMEKIYSLALHPSHNKRLGAAVLFNRQYTILREEDFILNAYWFELFYYFMESLRMCDGPENVAEIIEAIHHVERPLVEKSTEFNKQSPHRIIPPDFKGGQLCHLVEWAMERTCDLKLHVRRTAMDVVQKLAPLVENCDSNLSFSSKQLYQFFQLEENSFQSNFNEEEVINWLKYQSAGFECCTWLLEQKVLTKDEVLQPEFIAVLKQFITSVLEMLSSDVTVRNLKQQSILSFLNTLYALREKTSLYPSEHWDLLKAALFKPNGLGFDLNRETSTQKLFLILTKILRYFDSHLTANEWTGFYENLENVIVAPVFKDIVSSQQVNVESLEFLFALRVIERAGIWKTFVEKTFFSIKEDLFVTPIFKSFFFKRGDDVFAVAVEPSPKSFIEEVLNIMMKVGASLKGVMNCLANEEEVLEEETTKKIKKGEFFQLLFKNSIFTFLVSEPDLLLEWVLEKKSRGVKLLIQILENQSQSSDVPKKVFQNWEHFKNINITDATQKRKLLLNLAVSAARCIGTPGFLKNSPIADEVYNILETRKLETMDIFEIEAVVSLLPFLSHFGEGLHDNNKLSRCLSKIQIDLDILNKSDESFDISLLQSALVGILRTVKSTASLVVLNFLLKRADWFNTVCQKEDMESVLSVFGQKSVSVEHSVVALQLCYRFCFECDKPNFLPSVIYKQFLNPLMNVVPEQAVLEFTMNNIEDLCKLITTYWGDDCNTVDVLIHITRKTCAAEIFQTFISRLPKEKLDEVSVEKRQLMFAMVKNVFLLLKKPYPPLCIKDRYRKLMCEIFNMICCIVNARCSEEKFYKLFIFDERGTFLFESVDKTSTFKLDMDFDEIPKRKKHLTSLRKTIVAETQPSFEQNSIKYIQTNTLFTSSLQEDVTQFDFTSSFIRPLDSVPHSNPSLNEEMVLEMDSLNNHDCMATLVATITRMIRDGITPIDDITELPCWLKFFVSVLTNPDLCDNLKLFTLKVIYNIQTFVAPFCKQIFPELVDSILKLLTKYPINYLFIDLIETMIEWRHVPQDERSQSKLTKLVEVVLEKSDSLKNHIVKNNIEILKTVVEVWKSVLHLPDLSSFVFKRLSKSVEEDFKAGNNADSVSYLNIHAAGVLLSNGIPAWSERSEKQFFDLILKNFRRQNKHNELFGQICGLALSLIQKTDPNALEEYEKLVQDKISSLADCWLQLLYGVHKHYPRISSRFTFRLFSTIQDSSNSMTVKRLQMLLSHVSGSEVPEDPTFERHAFAFLMDMLNSSDVAIYEISLQIVEKLLVKMDDDQLRFLTSEIVKKHRRASPEVRKWMYEICKKLYRKNPNEFVLKQCKIILLKGLSDGVEELEDSCLKFWRSVLTLSSPNSAILVILKDMYASETEQIFLSNAARVLLHFAADDYKSQTHIFLHPITHQCKFQKRNLVTGSRQSFLLTQASEGRTLTNQSVEHLATIRHRNLPYLRPSLSSLKFQPTVKENMIVSQTVTTPNDSTQSSFLPSNPAKKRFGKTISFSKWVKKKPLMDEDDWTKEEEVEIFGEYRDGDYPDIQISHAQMTKLLEVLSRKDDEIARMFLVSFFSGVIKTVQGKYREAFLLETSTRVNHLLKTSENFNPGVFGFVFQLLLNHSKELNIDCQLISKAAVSSNWISLGALIIEEIISNKEGEEGVAEKRRECETPEEKRWLELAKLYRGLEEFDVLSGIFLDKLHAEESARQAICCEMVFNWQDAFKHYQNILRSDSNSIQREFYTESYFWCLAKLSDWSALNKCIRSTVNNDLTKLWNNYNLLSWFLKSEMMTSLGSDEREFEVIVKSFCETSVRENILSTNFGEEMAVFDWFSENLQRASYRIDKLCLDFLAEWSHLDRWSHKLRAAKLKKLQTLSELNFVVKNLAEVSKSQLKQNVKERMKYWEKNLPAPCDDLTVWDVKLAYRREFVKCLKDPNLRVVDVKSCHTLAKAALSQQNLNMAKEYLSRAKENLPSQDFELKSEHSICFNTGKMVLARMRMKDPNVGMEVYLNVWSGISKQLNSLMETDSLNTLTYTLNFALGCLVADILPYVKNRIVASHILEVLCKKLNSTQTDIAHVLRKKGLEYFEAAHDALQKEDCSSETKSNTYLELAKFLLRFPAAGSFESLCRHTLKAMELGNSEARQLFGCVINSKPIIPREFPFYDLISISDRVPSWMFLSWINQMLACLSYQLAPLLKSILLRVTEDYPNAIRYMLKMMDDLKSSIEPKVKVFLVKLDSIVSKDKLYDYFWVSLKYLASPDVILSYHLRDILQEASQPQPNYNKMKENVNYLQDLMFSTNYSKFRGPVFEFWNKFQQPLEDLQTVCDKKEAVKEKVKNMLSSIVSAKMPSKRTLALLESYSPWLYNFHSLKADIALELPGQYDGSRKPIKKYLVTISSFRNNVLVFDSKCRPMRIGILGNDAKEHMFLIKFGEDLRQDERIQQVFRHFNYRLKESILTSRFSVQTYKVIPMTLNLGMIEWVEGHVSLYEMMESSLGNNSHAIGKAQAAHLSFLCQTSPQSDPIAAHLVGYKTISREKAISNFKVRVQDFPNDLLKKSFLDLSTSPEHFAHLRGNFATSHAVMCMTHWLVGIGDRHLQNTLVSTKTGRVLGVDFGYAFGFATQLLTPPELLPFRLTPQILNLMHPMGESGWIKQTMIHCLRVFRKERFKLQSVLEVFAQEPVMDWLKQTKKKPTHQQETADRWQPREKLDLVERKLSGVNPVVIIEVDLKAGHSGSNYLEKYLEVLRGVEGSNIRARCAEIGLTEEEEVECLIDLASDPHVLAKTYIGWNPWL